MTEQYVQKIDVDMTPTNRKKQIFGTLLILSSLCFIMLAGFLSLYYLIGFFILFVAGIVVIQFFNNTVKEYEYDINTVRLVISKTNVINRRHRVLELLFEDITCYDIFSDITMENDIIACNNIQSENVRYILFEVEGNEHRLLFEPDDYMQALIIEIREDIEKRKVLNDLS